MEKKFKSWLGKDISKENSLNDKRRQVDIDLSELNWVYPEEDVKEHIQNAQRRLKRCDWIQQTQIDDINEIFSKEFGKELLK